MKRRSKPATSLDDVARAEGIDPDALLRDVARFRMALDVEMSLAAAAAELGRPDIAAEALGGASDELEGWAGAMASAPAAPAVTPIRPRTPVRGRYVGTAVAAGLVGLLLGLAIPAVTTSHPSRTTDALRPASDTTLLDQANTHFHNLAVAADGGDPTAVADAARTLQSSISQLVAAAQAGDTAAGQRAAQILLGEKALMSKVPAAQAAALLAEESRLTSTLQAALRTTLPLLASGRPSPIAGLLSGAHVTVPKVSPSPLVFVDPASPSKVAEPSGTASAPTTATAPTTAPAPASTSPSPAASSTSPAPLGLPSAGASQGNLGGLTGH